MSSTVVNTAEFAEQTAAVVASGEKLGSLLQDAFGKLTGALRGPLVQAAVAAGQNAMNFDQAMGKINVRAQLDDEGRSQLATQLRHIALDNRIDIAVAPQGFETVLARVGDVNSAMPILDAAIKGSKAGFTDLDTVAGALAGTMSVLEGSNASAAEVMDTFLAAQHAGAGSLSDFAGQLPGLIAGASHLGAGYKDVAGVFSYFTGQMQSAEEASHATEALFASLGDAKVAAGLQGAGVELFDNGKLRSTADIIGQLQGTLAGLSSGEQDAALQRMGFGDESVRASIVAMSGDLEGLSGTLARVGDSSGETGRSLVAAGNAVGGATELWTSLQNVGTQLGSLALPLINGALAIALPVLDAINGVVSVVADAFAWWSEQLSAGDPLIWAVSTALAGLAGILGAYTLVTNGAAIASGAKAMADTVLAGTTAALTAVQWALNAAFLASPIGWIVVGVGALVGALVWAWNKFEGFRQAVYGVWEVLKMFGGMLLDAVMMPIRNMLGGLGALGSAIAKLFKGDFRGAVDSAKDGAKQLLTAATGPAGMVAKLGKDMVNADFRGAYDKGSQKGTESWQASQEAKAAKEKGAAGVPAMPQVPGAPAVPGMASGAVPGVIPGAVPQAPGLPETPKLPGRADAGAGKAAAPQAAAGGEAEQVTAVENDPAANRKGSTMYGAILSRLAPVAASVAMPLSVAATPLPISGGLEGPASGMVLPGDVTAPGQSQQGADGAGTPGRSISMERFCDQIVINVQRGDGQDAQAIADRVMEEIRKAISDEV